MLLRRSRSRTVYLYIPPRYKKVGATALLTRQKILLAILHTSNRPLSTIELVKLAFLLRHESEVGSNHTFYDFVPYKFGPFSFALYRELEALQGNGYLEVSESSIRLSDSTRKEALQKIGELTTREHSAVAGIFSRFGKMKTQALIHAVYSRYPWFTINSELSDLIPKNRPKRPRAKIAIYTSGYEGKSVDAFFDHLISAGIRTIVDVRFNPVSRKYGFAGSSLRRIGEKLGLVYNHVPELGIEGKHRESLDDYESYQRLLDRYARSFLAKQQSALGRLAEVLQKMPSVLVCMEKDVNCCHRGRLANEMADRTRLSIVHL
jgi:uncharacterized protein (DUF488 family)